MVMASNGGFRWTELYQMPTYLRKFYLKKLQEWKKREQEQAEAGKSGNTFVPPGGKLPPALKPAVTKGNNGKRPSPLRPSVKKK